MDIRNSQKKSPRSSARSEKKTPERSVPPSRIERDEDNEGRYTDRSMDHVARVRAAREAAQREMESFGDVSEYDITIIQGQLKEESSGPPQTSLDFPADAAAVDQEEAK